MRIRSTKPEFWRSERIASVEWDARLVLKGLESYVDDNGVGKDDMALIVGDVFSRDLIREPSRTLARVTEALNTLHEAGLLWRYEVDGTKLLYVAFWETVQRIDRPSKGRFPRPDGTWEYGESEIREPDASPRESSRALVPGTGEQGNRGTGEQGGRGSRIPADFTVTDSMRAWAAKSAPFADVDRSTERFTDHWLAASGKNATKLDWTRAWQNWLRKDSDDTPERKRQQAAPPTKAAPRKYDYVPPFDGDPDDLVAYNAHYAKYSA